MSDRFFRIGLIIIAGFLYAGIFGYSVVGVRGLPFRSAQTSPPQTRPPRVMYYDDDVDVYARRSVRTFEQRGGGLRGGK